MTTTAEPSWVEPLRQSARGRAQASVEVAHGERPGLFDAESVHALSSVLLAAFIVFAALFRTQIAPVPFDLLGLLLRTAAVAFVVRASIASVRVFWRVRRDSGARSCALAWSSDGLYLRTLGGEQWVARSDVLDVVLPEQRASRASVPSLRPVLVVTRPEGVATCWALPPYFAATPEILAARLARWLGREETDPAASFEPPQEAPSMRYERAAHGRIEPGECVVPEGFGYRLRAPYAALLGVVFAADALRVSGPLRDRLVPASAAACLLAVSFVLGWLTWMNRKRATRLGIGMLLTREELLVRGKGGVVSVPWGQLGELRVSTRLVWSPFVGSYLVRILLLTTTDGGQLVFDAGFLGVPAEVVAALAEAYRRARI